MFKIALCIKQVPDTANIKWTENNTIQREGVESIINPYDVYATELALKIKENIKDAQITVFTMGPNQAQEMLQKVLALGCDEAVLISDRKFAGADTYATGKTISAAIKKELPDFDLVVCGQFAVDGDTAQTGPCIANFLNIPQVTYVQSYIEGNSQELKLKRELDDGQETVKVKLPALICVLQDTFEPKRATINDIKRAQNKQIKICDMENLGLTPEATGLRGSPTFVSRAFRDLSSHNPEKFELSVEESVQKIKSKVLELGAKDD